ncbi:hypothetical protein [Glacieibacterium sp.]|uniref:hypothetical protein n=1 Tax=Glacieibacterium sp. TaxID=2860237 RepID=UPI003B00F784
MFLRTVASSADSDNPDPPTRVCFFFNSQRHQLLHGISIATELARLPGFEVLVLSPSAGHIAYAEHLVEQLGGAPIHYEAAQSQLLDTARAATGRSIPPKLLTLAVLASRLNSFDAIALPERTSSILKKFGARSPRYIHLDHGAGDRAAGFDWRIARFDMVLMAGDKHRCRMLREGLVRDGCHAVVGYPKFDAAEVARDPGWQAFPDDRPVVLYNPHFADFASWRGCGAALVDAFAAQDRYNLIVAPHIRLLDQRSERARWDALVKRHAGNDRILFDGGSDRLIDMSYTTLADVYVGDVSSQVYEFLRTPKPCLFLNPHGIDWIRDENYLHWNFGQVLRTAAGIIEEIDIARVEHSRFRSAQVDGIDRTFASGPASASARAAAAIAGYLRPGERQLSKLPATVEPALRVAGLRVATG